MSDPIDRQAAIDAIYHHFPDKTREECAMVLHEVPSAQPEIIRCEYCKYRGGLSGFYCDIVKKLVGVNSFCCWAERRTDETG